MIKKQSRKKAFSLIELSVVSVIIGVLIAGIMSGKRLISQSSLQGARALTKTSAIQSIPDLTLWLEPALEGSITGATSVNNLSNGDAISSWNDISGNVINVTQSSNYPTYLTSGINNLPSINFNGTNNYLSSTSQTPISAGDDTFTFVAVWSGSSVSKTIFEQNNNGTLTNGARAALVTSSINGQYGFDGESISFKTTTYSPGSPTISIVTVDGVGTVNIYNKSNTATSGTIASATQNVTNNIFIIGAKGLSAKTEFFNGQISEIMVFDRELSAIEVSIVNQYLSKKYNITLS